MGLDLWFREDVARILAATFEAMSNAHRHGSGLSCASQVPVGDGRAHRKGSGTPQAASSGNADYQLGFEDALRAVGVAFGVATPRGAESPRVVEPGHIVEGERWNGRSW